MKLLFLILSLVCFAANAAGQTVQLDTIYYDSEWKVVSSPAFASFYRIAEKILDPNATKRFRDYYITGEIQSEGGFLSLDPYDDSNSVMNGKWKNFYKNGKVEAQGNRVNGKEDGDYITFYENGSIKSRGSMKNGEPHGLVTEFTEDGLCIQQEYENGKPKTDYYIMSNEEGYYSKICIYENQPIWESPALSEKKVQYQDGKAWPYYVNDGIMIAMTNSETDDYGSYYRIFIVLTNSSFFPIEFDPLKTIAILTDEKGREKYLEIQTAEQYEKRIKRTQTWEGIFLGFANGLAASNAGYSQSTTTNNFGGVSTTRTYDAGASYQAQLAASQQMAAFSDRNFQIRQQKYEGYLKRNTINPGETISGYFNIKRKDGETLDVILSIGGASYLFPWKVSH